MLAYFSHKSFSKIDKYSIVTGSTILLLALSMYLINKTIYQYQGIEYIPFKQIILSVLNLALLNIGFYHTLRANHPILNFLSRINLIYLILFIMVIYTSEIQLTPFSTIDPVLLSADRAIGIDTPRILQFTHRYPFLFDSFTLAYSALGPELTITLLLAAFFYDKKSQSQLLFLLLSSTLIGFTFYYFFPSTAPATLVDSPLFLIDQHYTHIKFDLIHAHLPIESFTGGLIAMPSYHCIWILICQYYLMRFKWLGRAILPLNVWLIISCLFLGWHYFVDILTSMVITLSLIVFSKRITT